MIEKSATERVVIFETNERATETHDPERSGMGAGDTHNAAKGEHTVPADSPHVSGGGEPYQGAAVAYCQQCGTGLTPSSLRQVGSGIYCEPCAIARHAQEAGWAPVAGSPVPPPNPAITEPNPVLAGWLGLIPGVGAMYNGQYTKGVVHLVIFVVLLSLGDNLNWVFYWFVWGWIFYQGFEAYHTALARRNGLPLQNPFGLNDLAERLGFFSVATSGRVPVRPVPPSPTQGYANPAPGQAAGTYTGSVVPPFTSVPPRYRETASGDTSANFRAPGFPTASGPAQTAGIGSSTPPANFAGATPYTPTYTGDVSVPPAPAGLNSHTARFPGGAVWLIGLGALFLLGNILPSWRVDGRWLVPVLLAGIALWIGGQRVVSLRDTQPAFSLAGTHPDYAGVLLGPILLFTVAVLLALQDAHVIPLRHSWPALLMLWGALLLFSRARHLGTDPATFTTGKASVPNAATSPTSPTEAPSK